MCLNGYYEQRREWGRVEFMSNFKSVVEQLRNLENERKNLLLEIVELKKMADSKSKALESEVGMLREEVKSLRVLLGAEEPAVEEDQQQKKKPPRR
jgi:regulator of replication initiation timing